MCLQQNESLISDNQAEAGVISTLFIHPEFILQTDYLKPEYFYHKDNACIYWAIQQLYQHGVDKIDAVNLTNMINSRGGVKKLLESYNLENMQQFIDTSHIAARQTIEEYKLLVNTIVTLSYKRELSKVSEEIENACFRQDFDLKKITSLVDEKINNLTEKYIVSTEIETFGNHIDDLWSEICSRRSQDGIYGIPSKFPILSDYFTYEPGELVLLKARMKRGKSAFFLNEAVHKLKMGVPTVYLDTEMQDRLFAERLLANLTGIEIKRIKTGNYSLEEGKLLEDTNEWIKKQPFVHLYLPQTTDEEIYAIHKVLKYKMNVQFSIFDYIKSNVLSASEQYNALGGRTDFLKNVIAGELNMAVLAGIQLNRNNQVADSDKVERYASTSILWREKTSDEITSDGGLKYGNFCLKIDLNRNGEMMDEDDYICMNFDGSRMRIEQAEQPEREKLPFE